MPGTRQPTFAHDLLIGPVDAVGKADNPGSARVVAVEGSGWTQVLPEPTKTFALTVRLATRKDMPSEHGSEGPRDERSLLGEEIADRKRDLGLGL